MDGRLLLSCSEISTSTDNVYIKGGSTSLHISFDLYLHHIAGEIDAVYSEDMDVVSLTMKVEREG